MDYDVDLRDVIFQLFEWLPTERLLEADRFADWDRDSVEMVVTEALKIAQEELAPTNEEGDRSGCKLVDAKVTVPEPFGPAYKTLAEGGWIGSVNNSDVGGLGLPHVVGTVANELFAGANLSISLVMLLTRGASELIEDFGTDEMRGLFCEKLYSGQWTGTMCLTEPSAGSDVGASVTRAVEQENGRYLISGEKIFITYGDHDLTDNVIHTVLARLPDAPSGTRGLSLFVVPKIRVDPDGGLGESNDVVCGGIEHKLGIHGSPTCSMLFGQNGNCEGYLLGEKNKGMKMMFQMMNSARLEVGLQGAAVAGAAHQAALAFAKERIQSRNWSKFADPEAPPVAIVEHPDVRRMLLTSGAYVQAMRALLLQSAYYIDMSHVAEGEERERFQSYVELLTPICKAWASDWGFRVTEWCLQVFGGYGYTRDYPAEQYLRDAKIASIYEGTNGIQALDLVGRKMRLRDGDAVRELLGLVGATVKKLRNDPELDEVGALLGEALGEIGEVTTGLGKRSDAMLVMLLNAVPFLDMMGNTLAAHYLLDQAFLARSALQTILEARGVDAGDEDAYQELLASDSDAAFYHNKVQTAIHFGFRVLPQVRALAVAIKAGELAPMKAVM
ncbi:MAG: acyl-CoA dehydrogenase [Thermoanaerobaculia bacterium]